MHFSNIELYNYGIYKGKHSIALQNRTDRKNITLIGGMNGRGKTTILDAIFLCLYGRKSVEYITGKKEAYSLFLKDRINKSASVPSAYVNLVVELDDDSNTTISIKRSWGRNDMKIESTLSVLKNGIADNYLSQNWEYYVEELIPFGIAKFFFFDNEKISQIADDDAFDKIKDSIKSVMGVVTIESLIAHIQKIAKEKGSAIRQAKDKGYQAEYNDALIALETCEKRIRTIMEERASLVPQLEKTINDLETAEQTFWKKGGNLSLKRSEIEQNKRDLKAQSDSLREEAVALASSPSTPLCLCKELMAATYHQSISSEDERARRYSYPIVKELYEDLLRQCDAKFADTAVTETLRLLAQEQLAQFENALSLTGTPALTPVSISLMEKFVREDATIILLKAKRIIANSVDTETALQQLEVHLSSTAEQSDTLNLLKKIKNLEVHRTQLENDIAKCDEQLKSSKFEMEQLENQSRKIMLKIAADADTNDDNLRILKYSTMTVDIMNEFMKRLQSQKVEKLEANIAKCFKYLAQKEAIITSIAIDPETLDITLRDYQGGLLLKQQLSAGEKQMFAISIIWGLALSSGYKLPVIIDTPMARLDSAHRSNFINKYLPSASSQVLVLSTDEEIYGKYLEDIKEYVGAAYTLVYDEDEKCSSIWTGYFGGTL